MTNAASATDRIDSADRSIRIVVSIVASTRFAGVAAPLMIR